MKEIMDALMGMLMRKGVITKKEYNEYLIASENSSQDPKRVVEVINKIGK